VAIVGPVVAGGVLPGAALRVELGLQGVGEGLRPPALRVAAAPEEGTALREADDHLGALALRARLVDDAGLDGLPLLVDREGVLALGPAGAGHEAAALAAADHHRLAALLADLVGRLGRGALVLGLAVLADAEDRLALGVARAP